MLVRRLIRLYASLAEFPDIYRKNSSLGSTETTQLAGVRNNLSISCLGPRPRICLRRSRNIAAC
jgi:hypothetical protein